MLNVKKDFIGAKGLELFKGKEKEEKESRDNTLDKMMQELKESTKQYREENKIYYKKVDEQLAEIKGLLKYTLTEQEKQRIASMNANELLLEMKQNLDKIKKSLDEIAGDK